MAAGTAASVNTYFVQLEKKVGHRARSATWRNALGVSSPTLERAGRDLVGSLTLGSREVSPAGHGDGLRHHRRARLALLSQACARR